MLCSADKRGFFSCKSPSINYQPQTPKSSKLGNRLPVQPSYCPQLVWSDSYRALLSPHEPHMYNAAPHQESPEVSVSFSSFVKIIRKLFVQK